MSRIEVVKGDITKQKVDAIVNAANTTLLGGGGVDGAIHREAGPELLKECRALNGCKVGEAKITQGYNLPAKWVIHTVGPVWSGGGQNEEKLLADCYRNALALAQKKLVRSIAFPAISTGAYRFPILKATEIVFHEMGSFLKKSSSIEKVLLVCFEEKVFRSYISFWHHGTEDAQ